MRGQQQDLPGEAVAALEGAEQWIQQQLVASGGPGPGARDDQAAELPPPRGGSGWSASCTLQGHALSLQEYALRVLLAHPQRYAFVMELPNTDARLAQIARSRDHMRGLLAAVEGRRLPAVSGSGAQQAAPGNNSSAGDTAGGAAGVPGGPVSLAAHPHGDAAPSSAQGTAVSAPVVGGTVPQVCAVPPSSDPMSTPEEVVALRSFTTPSSSLQQQLPAPGGDMPLTAAAHEAALHQVAVHMLHCLTTVAVAHLVDPTISYGTIHRASQLAGPLAGAKLEAMVAAVQLSQQQRSQIAARVRVVNQLLAPVHAAWDLGLRGMRQVLLEMQQHQQHQQQAALVAGQGLTPAAAAMAGAAAARGAAPAPAPAANDCAQQAALGVSAAPIGQRMAPPGAEDNLHNTEGRAAMGAVAADLHTRLSHLVQRLNTLHRTLGWLETTQGFAGLGVLTWQQLGRLMVESDPYPMAPRYIVLHIASQWEEEHMQDTGANGHGTGADGGQSPCRGLSGQDEVLLQRSRTMEKHSLQQQRQTRQQHVGGLKGISSQGPSSSRQQQQRQARQLISTREVAPPPGSFAGRTGSEQWLAAGLARDNSQACAGAAINPWRATHCAEQAPPGLQPDHPYCLTHSHHPQQLAVSTSGAVMDVGSSGPSTTHALSAGEALLAGLVPTPPVQQRPPEVQRGSILQDLLALCEVVLEGGGGEGGGRQELCGATALDALLDMLLE